MTSGCEGGNEFLGGVGGTSKSNTTLEEELQVGSVDPLGPKAVKQDFAAMIAYCLSMHFHINFSGPKSFCFSFVFKIFIITLEIGVNKK